MEFDVLLRKYSRIKRLKDFVNTMYNYAIFGVENVKIITSNLATFYNHIKVHLWKCAHNLCCANVTNLITLSALTND